MFPYIHRTSLCNRLCDLFLSYSSIVRLPANRVSRAWSTVDVADLPWSSTLRHDTTDNNPAAAANTSPYALDGALFIMGVKNVGKTSLLKEF